MKKIYAISGLDCMVCADNLENKLGTITGVKSVSVNFFLQKLTLEADETDFESVLKRVKRVVDHTIPGALLS